MKDDKQMRIILGDALCNEDQGTWSDNSKEKIMIKKAISLGYLTLDNHLITREGTNHLINLQADFIFSHGF